VGTVNFTSGTATVDHERGRCRTTSTDCAKLAVMLGWDDFCRER